MIYLQKYWNDYRHTSPFKGPWDVSVISLVINSQLIACNPLMPSGKTKTKPTFPCPNLCCYPPEAARPGAACNGRSCLCWSECWEGSWGTGIPGAELKWNIENFAFESRSDAWSHHEEKTTSLPVIKSLRELLSVWSANAFLYYLTEIKRIGRKPGPC